MKETTESYKLKTNLLDEIRKLKKEDGHSIVWHIDRAISNYLKAKKILLR